MQPQAFVYLAVALQCFTGVAAFNFGTMPAGWTGQASFKQKGTTGVAAMQLTVTTNDKIVLLDRVEINPLKNKKNIPYWGAELSVSTSKVRGLSMITNSFCAGGAWLGNGTLVSLGGDPYTGNGGYAQMVGRESGCSILAIMANAKSTRIRKTFT